VHPLTLGELLAFAGRDAAPSECVLLYDEQDLETQMQFLRWSNPDADFYRRVFDLIAGDTEKANAFGLDYLREKLLHKAKGDFRLETALRMLERHGAFEGQLDPLRVESVDRIPDDLASPEHLAEKLKRDQQRLYEVVRYTKLEEGHKAFIHDYFGLPEPAGG